MEYSKRIGINKSKEAIIYLIFLLASIFIFLDNNLLSLSVAVIIVLITAVFPSKSIVSKIVALMYSLILLILIQGKIITFDFIPQAEELLKIEPNLVYWFSNGHPHSVRLLVAYPGYLISELYGIDLDLGFSYYVCILFTLLHFLIMDTLSKFEKNNLLKEIKGQLIVIPLLILPFIMNGRLILAYVGFSILIRLFIDLFYKKPMSKMKVLIVWLIGYLLTTVSSGTMTVALVYSVFLIYLLYRNSSNKRLFKIISILSIILLSPLIYIVLSYFYLMLMRNVDYYGGGFSGAINMLNHGFGRYLISNTVVSSIAAFLAIIGAYVNIRYLQRKIKRSYYLVPVLAAINICIYGFLFGQSTGLMIIPPLIMLVLIKL